MCTYYYCEDTVELSCTILPCLEKELASAHNAVALQAEPVAAHQAPCAIGAVLDLRAPQFSIANVAMESEYLGEPLALSPDTDIPSLDLPQPAWGGAQHQFYSAAPPIEAGSGAPIHVQVHCTLGCTGFNLKWSGRFRGHGVFSTNRGWHP